MPTWLAILCAVTPGLIALGMAFMHTGAMRADLKNIAAKIQDLPQMAEDISYLKGLEAGKRAAAVDILTETLQQQRRSHLKQVATGP